MAQLTLNKLPQIHSRGYNRASDTVGEGEAQVPPETTPPHLQQLNSHCQAFISCYKRRRKQRRAFYSQVGAAVPGICHVLTARVIEFIMRALEKLKADYGQPSPC